jgi:hypothetical protein
MAKRTRGILVFATLLTIVLMTGYAMAVPFGATAVSEGKDERAGATGSAQNHGAYAGNVTELTVDGGSVTQAWQGYFGNVTGTLMLADASDNVMYNWSDQSPGGGEIYASTNDTITWANIQCFNLTAFGNYSDESGNGGTTNIWGTNVSILESEFGIDPSDGDGVDETFNHTWFIGGGTHDEFVTGTSTFSAGECTSIGVFTESGTGEDGSFEEVLLYEPATSSVVFASLLENDGTGFDSALHDFQMLVLEDGHDDDTSTTDYYFYIELAT